MKGLTTQELTRSKHTSMWIYSILIAGSLLVSGCGTKRASPDDPIQKNWSRENFSSERDSGVVLTSAEKAALHSTGQVDKKISDKGMEDVTVQYTHYVRKGRATVERAAQRAEKYLAHSRKVFRQRGVPEELAYLAIVESGYNPAAVSPAGAAGAWQFMPFTGAKYGLDQDWWMDERRDPYESAEAAADYLKKLYGDFKDWHLAIAAYNAGEGKIGRALDQTGTVSFFKLTEKNHTLNDKAQLREETKQYVPRFIAICKIMRNLEALGFTPIDPSRAEAVVPLTVRPGTDLMALSNAMGMDWKEFHSYNMAYKRYVSPTDRSTVVYVPQRSQQTAQAYLRNPRSSGYAGWKPYTVRRGDTWASISQRSAVPTNILQSANKGANLKQGAVVLLPGSESLKSIPVTVVVENTPAKKNAPIASREKERPNSVTNAASKTVASTDTGTRSKDAGKAAQQPATPASHTLQAGDTLSAVAARYDVSVRELMAANAMEDANRIRQGQVLRIPNGSSAPAPVGKAPQPMAVASTKGPQTVAVASTKGSQPVAVASTKAPAKQERVHGSTGSLGRGATPAPKKQATYTVQAGDTLWGIAKKHNVQPSDLLQWNKSDGKSPLRPGDSVVVYSNN